MDGLLLAIYIVAFPGLLFLIAYAFLLQYADRKLTARMQSRVGPPFLQPFADFVKLLSKEDVVTEGADAAVARWVPLLTLASVAVAFLYVPVVGASPLAFEGDLVLVLYLLTVPTILLLALGWTSRNVFAAIGGVRAVTQLFLYEVPFFLAMLGPALAAGTWSISGIGERQLVVGAWFAFLQPLGFAVALLGLQARLERAPFDIPGAETEIVAGSTTELTGRKLAVMHLASDAMLVTGSALVAAMFLGGPSVPWTLGALVPVAGFAAFLLKTFAVLLFLVAVKAAMGRLRIDQLERFGWTYLAGAALLQMFLVLLTRGWSL